jgi:sugar-specific transcriptional regulator TrmB
MCPSVSDQPRAVAVEQLEQLGLSGYAARTYVALAALESGTARDVSQVSSVPRTRVYDAVEELRERGLVDVRQSSPKEFWATSPETASRTFERELHQRTETLRAALDEVGPAAHYSEQQGVWTVDGETAVSQRVLDFLAEAREEIVYMTVEDLLTDELLAALREAAERGVSVQLGGVSPAVQAEIQDEIPNLTTFESLWLWSDTSAGRLLMTDRTQTLVSALVNGRDGSASDPRSETAIWGRGDTNSLVVVLRAIFAWRLENLD